MSFLNLAALGFLALLPVIILMYLLRLRRKPQVVPSTLFWQKALEDLTANAPFQKLRRNLLMYVQLLMILLLALTLARPLMNLKARDGRALLVLIDVSASMQAREEGGQTRFQEAREIVRGLIGNMLEGDSMMLVTFARAAEVAAAFTRDRAELERRLGEIKPTHEGSNLADAYRLALSIAGKREAAEVIIVSDGALPPVPPMPERENPIPVRFVKTGLRSENVGFTTVDLRQAPENPRDIQLFARITNFGALAASVPLEIRNNDKLIDRRLVALEPKSSMTQLLDGATLEEGTIQLTLETADPFPVDDNAFVILKRPAKTTVLLVSAGNYFLEKVINFDRDLNAELATVSPAGFDPSTAKDYDVVVLDCTVPPMLTPGNYLVIGAIPPLEGFAIEEEEEIASPPVVDWNSEHPVMRYVELSDVAIGRALAVRLPAASQILAETTGGRPLIAWASSGNRNVVLYAFDIFDTNLPLRMAFPLLISNTLHWLSQGKAATLAGLHRTGDVIEIAVRPTVKKVEVRTPEGRAVEVRRGESSSGAFDRTALVGFYGVTFDGEPQPSLGVNLLNEAESDIAPRTSIEVEGTPTVSDTGLTRINTEVWQWFAIAALALLMLEWWMYHRRIGVR